MRKKSIYCVENFSQLRTEQLVNLEHVSNLVTIRYTPARLVITTIPKSGSTTLIATFLVLAGFGSENPWHFIRERGAASRLAEHGLTIKAMRIEEVKHLQKEFGDYYFATVMRDPAQRLVSGYFNKINRYCKRFARPIYFWGKLRQFLQGPSSWGDINCGNYYMRQFVRFEDFLAGLEQHGTGWDKHFAPQSILAGTKKINYQDLIRLEKLDTSLTDLLAMRGIDSMSLEKLRALQRFNVTEDTNRKTLLTNSILKRIEDLYQIDYCLLQRDKSLSR